MASEPAATTSGDDGLSHGGKCNTSLHVTRCPVTSLKLFAVAGLMFAATLPGSAQSRATVTVDGLPARGKIHELQHDAAGLERTGARDVAARRSVLVSQHDRRPAASSSSSMRRRRTKAPAFNHAAVAAALTTAMGKPVTATRLPFTADHVRRRQHVVLVRQRRQALDLRRAGQAVHVGRSARARFRTASCRPTASYAAYIKDYNLWVRDIDDRRRQAAHDRRRQGLRLRHRQRRLDQQRSSGAQVVAGLEEDRDLPAGSAQGRRHVSRQHRRRAIRRCGPGNTRCPATSTSR